MVTSSRVLPQETVAHGLAAIMPSLGLATLVVWLGLPGRGVLLAGEWLHLGVLIDGGVVGALLASACCQPEPVTA